MNIESAELRKVYLEALKAAKDRLKTVGENALAVARLDSQITVLETLLLWVTDAEKREIVDMEKVTRNLVAQVVKLTDVTPRARQSEIEDSILETPRRLQKGDAALIDPNTIKFGHFSSKVYALKKKGTLPPDIVVMKRKDKFYLAKQ